MKSTLISKSVRLPSELVEFVEQKDGRDFSKKLVFLLEDYRNGDASRQQELLYYEKQTESKKKLLREYQEHLYELSQLSSSCTGLVCRLRSYLEEMEERDHLPRDAEGMTPFAAPQEMELLEVYRSLSERAQKMLLRQAVIMAAGDGIPPPS